MTTLPTTPAECYAEQERVLARINAYDAALAEVCRLSAERTARYEELVKVAEEKGEEWPAIPDPTPEHWAASEAWAKAQQNLPDPTLARQYAALLAPHAEALAEVERLRKNRDQIATDNETLSVWNANLEAEMRGYRASRNAAHAEALERERWIPVEERLPEDGQRVLFVNIGGQVLVDTSTLERAVRLLSEYANSDVPDAVSLECAQVCGKLRNALAQPQPSPSAGEVLVRDDSNSIPCANCGTPWSQAREHRFERAYDGEWFCSAECEKEHEELGCPFENRPSNYRLPFPLRALAIPDSALSGMPAIPDKPERAALELAAEVLEESGGRDIDTRCHDQAAQGSAKLGVARYLRSLIADAGGEG